MSQTPRKTGGTVAGLAPRATLDLDKYDPGTLQLARTERSESD